MKRRFLSLLMAAILLLCAVAPGAMAAGEAEEDAALSGVTGHALAQLAEEEPDNRDTKDVAVPTEGEVYNKINSLRGLFYEGLHWTNDDNFYVLSSTVANWANTGRNFDIIGSGCVAFCFVLSDYCFGNLNPYTVNTSYSYYHDSNGTPYYTKRQCNSNFQARAVYNYTYDSLKVGDMLRINNDRHIVTILKKYADHVVITEGNYNYSVHWDRTLTKREVMAGDYVITRYPEGYNSVPLPSNLSVNGLKSSYTLGDTVAFTPSASGASYYKVSIYKNAYGSGDRLYYHGNITTETVKFKPSSTGTYAVRVEAVNSAGYSIYIDYVFTVAAQSVPLPSNLNVSGLKGSYVQGDTVAFTTSASNAKYFKVSIYKDYYGSSNRVYYHGSITTETIKYKPTATGTYAVRVEAVNSAGQSIYKDYSFTVQADTTVSNLKVALNHANGQYNTGEIVTFTPTANNALIYTAKIWSDASGSGSILWDSGSFTGSQSIYFTDPGTYYLVVTATDGNTSAQTTVIITVYEPVETFNDDADRSMLIFYGSDSKVYDSIGDTSYDSRWYRFRNNMGGGFRVHLETNAMLNMYVYDSDFELLDSYYGVTSDFTSGTYYDYDGVITFDGYYDSGEVYYLEVYWPGSADQSYNYRFSLLESDHDVTNAWVTFNQRNYDYYTGKFSDVSSQWYASGVKSSYQLGLMNGTGNNKFNPSGEVTLAEAITMAARLHKIYYTGSDAFVQSGKWYQVYLDYCVEHGIIGANYAETNLTAVATRAQYAEILGGALPTAGFATRNTVYDNAVPDVNSYYTYSPTVYKFYRAGVLQGDSDNYFNPDDSITRAECAAIVARMANSDERVSVTLY